MICSIAQHSWWYGNYESIWALTKHICFTRQWVASRCFSPVLRIRREIAQFQNEKKIESGSKWNVAYGIATAIYNETLAVRLSIVGLVIISCSAAARRRDLERGNWRERERESLRKRKAPCIQRKTVMKVIARWPESKFPTNSEKKERQCSVCRSFLFCFPLIKLEMASTAFRVRVHNTFVWHRQTPNWSSAKTSQSMNTQDLTFTHAQYRKVSESSMRVSLSTAHCQLWIVKRVTSAIERTHDNAIMK